MKLEPIKSLALMVSPSICSPLLDVLYKNQNEIISAFFLMHRVKLEPRDTSMSEIKKIKVSNN